MSSNCKIDNSKKVPRNSPESLLMAISALVLAPLPHFGAIFGLVIGIVGLNTAQIGINRYNHNPRIYDNKKMLSIAKILAIMAIAINAVLAILLIIIAKNR